MYRQQCLLAIVHGDQDYLVDPTGSPDSSVGELVLLSKGWEVFLPHRPPSSAARGQLSFLNHTRWVNSLRLEEVEPEEAVPQLPAPLPLSHTVEIFPTNGLAPVAALD